ncbi:MAG: MarR family winged helix-turn-helix transcriptional regulator [Actinomycetota bacterium]|nr:MarR family winged helix-turn-helix transcriptional regulator [Actinomycetota bacterium]
MNETTIYIPTRDDGHLTTYELVIYDGVMDPATVRAANLLGAFALAASDRLRTATESASGTSAAAPAALVTIAMYPGCTIERLARALRITHSGSVRLVDRLGGEGLVRRRPGSDARSIALELSAAGRRAAEHALTARRDAMTQILDLLDEGERTRLVRLLEKALGGMTCSRLDANSICRLCDEPACERLFCPVDRAARAANSGR